MAANATLYGILHAPDDLATNSDPCALLVMNHGVGANQAWLEENGPIPFIKAGNKFVFTDPETKNPVRFFVLALLNGGWSPSAVNSAYAVRNEVLPAYPEIDKNMIFVTGLSAGGATTMEALTTTGVMDLYAAGVPMSPASTGNLGNAAAIAALMIRLWGFSGNLDGTYTENLKTVDAKVNQLAPGNSRTTIYAGGHGLWQSFYSPDYRESIWGGLMNIYEFMLAAKKGSKYAFSKPVVQNLKAILMPGDIVINAKTVDFDATQSVGVKKAGDNYVWDSVLWGLVPQNGNNWSMKLADTPGGKQYAQRTMTFSNPKDGDSWAVTITVKDVTGKEATATSIVTYKADTNQVPVVNAGADVTLTDEPDSVVLKAAASDSDGTVASIAWSQVSGPNTAQIMSQDKAETVINGLVPGIYEFAVQVTDNKGAKANDAVKVTVLPYTAPVPQIGETVLYYPADGEVEARSQTNTEPLAAIITRLWSGDMVNLSVFPDGAGGTVSKTSVKSRAGASGGAYWKPLQ